MGTLNIKFLIVLICLSAALRQGSCLRCYDCLGKDCRDNIIDDCLYCGKIWVSDDGDTDELRTCGIDGEAEDTCVSATQNDQKATVCACLTDLCNEATAITGPAWMYVMAALCFVKWCQYQPS